MVLGLVASIVIARVLGPEGTGAYALILLIPTLLVLLGNLGIGAANVYFGGSHRHPWPKLASNSLVLALVIGTALAGAFLTLVLLVRPAFLQGAEVGPLVLAALAVPLNLLTMYFSTIVLGQKRIKEYNLVGLAQTVSFVVLVLILLLAARGAVFAAVLAWAVSAGVAAVLAVLLVRRTVSFDLSFHPAVFNDSVRFGAKGYLGNAIQFLNYRLDMLLVALFMNVAFVGYYSISVAMAEALWYFPGAVGMVMFARTPGMRAEDANRSTPRICRNTFFLTIIGGLLLFVLGRYVITVLLGLDFLPSLRPLWILLPGVAALSIPKVLSNEMAGRGKPIVNTVAAGVSLAVNIPLNLLLIPRMGISGAALASTISYSVTAIVVLVAFLRISGNNWVDTILLKREDLQIYRNALSTARSLNLRAEGRRLTNQALSLFRPAFWSSKEAGPGARGSDHEGTGGDSGQDTDPDSEH